MGFCALGLGFMKKKAIEKWEWDFNLSNTGWDLKKTISWEMGLGPPLHDPPTTATSTTAERPLKHFSSVLQCPLSPTWRLCGDVRL